RGGGGIDYPWNGCRPLSALPFNLTGELPLKAIVPGYSWAIIPITWRHHRTGRPKFRIRERGSRGLVICLYIWLEKYFSRGTIGKGVPWTSESGAVAGDPKTRRSPAASGRSERSRSETTSGTGTQQPTRRRALGRISLHTA